MHEMINKMEIPKITLHEQEGTVYCICSMCVKETMGLVRFMRPMPPNLPEEIASDQKWHDFIKKLKSNKKLREGRKWLKENVSNKAIIDLFDSHFPMTKLYSLPLI